MEKGFLEFVADIFGCDVASLSLDTTPKDVACWTSLMQLRLVGEISDQYDIEIPIDEVAGITSLRDFFKYVENK